MTNLEIKEKIAGLKKALAASTDEGRKKAYQAGIDKLESQLEDSKDEPTEPKKMAKSGQKLARKKIIKAKAKTKSEARSQKSEEDKVFVVINRTRNKFKNIEEAKKSVKKEFHGEIRPISEWDKAGEEIEEAKNAKPEPKKVKTKIKVKVKPQSQSQPQPEPKPQKKKLIIKKEKKQETHIIETSFGKDIKDAILVLNKERFKIREIKDKKTGKTEQVKHSIEYKNAKTIQKRVNSIFDSAVYDIARTPKDKKEKKDIIEVVNDIRDLHSLWLNEIDIIIANEEKEDLERIKKLMIGLMKEARKNDEDNKWRNAGGLAEIANKFNL